MVVKIIFVFIFCLYFDRKVMAHNKLIEVYIPVHMVEYVLHVLDGIPGLQYKTGARNSDRRHTYQIDLNYYDEDREDKFDRQESLLYGRRNRAAVATHAGYTNNADTCKIYNDNLAKVWVILTKYIATEHKVPDNMALHNIALLIKAYLDHHDSPVSESVKEAVTTPEKHLKINSIQTVTEAIREIKEMITGAVALNITDKIIDLIVNNITLPMQGNKDKECAIHVKENLVSNVNREFQKYLHDSTCRRSINMHIDEAQNQNRIKKAARSVKETVHEHKKMDPNDAKKFLRQWQDNEVEICYTGAQEGFLERMRLTINDYILALQCNTRN